MKKQKIYRKVCNRCNEIFNPTGKFQRICENCSEENNRRIWDKEKEVFGYKKCPKWLKLKYLEAQDYCDLCKSKENLEPHRITRGNQNGLYTVTPLKTKKSNVQILCKSCHKKIHSKEIYN